MLAHVLHRQALLVADLVVGIALGSLVVGAQVAEQFPLAARATGIALSFGLATALIGGTAPLLAATRAQPPLRRDGAMSRSTAGPTAGESPG